MKLQICKIGEIYTGNDYPEKRQFIIVKKGLLSTKVYAQYNRGSFFRRLKKHDIEDNERFTRESAERILKLLVEKSKLTVVLEKNI